jgi:hypothetical protein
MELPVELVLQITEQSSPASLAALVDTSKTLAGIPADHVAPTGRRRLLAWAIKHGSFHTFRLALGKSQHFDISDDDEEEETPLHCAVYRYESFVAEIVVALVDQGEDPETSIAYHQGTPLDAACSQHNFEAAMALVRAGALVPDDCLASSVSLVRAKSAGGHVPDKYLERHKRLQQDFIREIVKGGLNIDWRPWNENGRPALIHAVNEGESSTVQLLLSLGADVNCRCGYGRPALIWAAEGLKASCVDLLLEAGANVNSVDDDGQSAGHVLPVKGLSRDAEAIWWALLMRGFDIDLECWHSEYRMLASIRHLAHYEASQGNGRLQELIWQVRRNH